MSRAELRELQLSDIPALRSLIRAGGFPNRSEAGWKWALFDNPEQADFPPGLLYMRDGKMLSFVGLQIRAYSGRGETKRVLMGHTLLSGPAGRGLGLSLTRKLLSYPGVQARQTNSNNAVSSKLFARLGVEPAHDERGREYVDWVMRPVQYFCGRVLNFLVRSDRMYRAFSQVELFGRQPKRSAQPVRHSYIKRLDLSSEKDCEALDQFNMALMAASPELYLPTRSAKTYKWRLSDPDFPGRSEMYAYFHAGEIAALLTTTLTKPNAHEPWVSYVTDFAYLKDRSNDDLLCDLINEARFQTRRRGACLLRFKPSLNLPEHLLARCGPHVRKAESHDYCFVNFADSETALQAGLVSNPFEADYIFALRAPLPKRVG